MKILGAAAARRYSFERCVEMGKAINSQLASIGSTLDHCHVPGRQNHDAIPDNVCVFGAGMHNEPVSAMITTGVNAYLIALRALNEYRHSHLLTTLYRDC